MVSGQPVIGEVLKVLPWTIELTFLSLFIGVVLGVPALTLADSIWVEPDWLKVHKIRLTKDKPTHRFVHFTDLHYKGDKKYLESVVQEINKLSPNFVCMTGDCRSILPTPA